jgi:hypothetical protein
MNNAEPMIKCRKCENIFQPDLKTKGSWICPRCQEKNPNLKRHYRSVADLCMLGLIVTIIAVAVGSSRTGITPGVLLSAAHGILLLITIVFVYKASMPWVDATAKILIWLVFGLALIFNVGIPLLFAGILNVPALVIYAIVFPYLFWLHSQASKCKVSPQPAAF